MKKYFALAAISLLRINGSAQTPNFDSLDINNVKAVVQSTGDLFWSPPYNFAEFNVPSDSNTSTIFAGAVWIGGLDGGNNLHVAAQTYRQSGNDFFQGPVQDSQWYTMQSNAIWNRVWKINKVSIDSLIQWQLNPALYPGYVIPNEILSWPGNGDITRGQVAQLAPYTDVDGDGIYNPQVDYPCIQGDQCVYFIFNDDRAAHTETGGQKMRVEIHGMMFGYIAPGSPIDSMIFIQYKLYNRSTNNYHDVYWGQWTDFDIGDPFDDFIGCSVERGLYYGYNGDSIDGFGGPGTYGVHPPSQGVVFLKGPLSDTGDMRDNDRDGMMNEPFESETMWQFMTYHNNFSVTGNPYSDWDHYNYLRSHWKDSTPLTYGGSGYGGVDPCLMMYPNDSDPLGWDGNFVPLPDWSEESAGNTPDDRRGIGSYGPFTLESGSSECILFAYVFARGAGNQHSGVAAMEIAADTARNFAVHNDLCGCGSNLTSVGEALQFHASIFPNPASNNINIICGDNSVGAQIEIIDATGKLVHTSTVLSGNSSVVDVSNFSSGIYFVRAIKGSVVLTGKFIRN